MDQYADHKIVDGTYYTPDTPDEVVSVLQKAAKDRTRLAIVYEIQKDVAYDVVYGRVGRSMGPVKVPLLIHNVRALGGEVLSTTCITEIRESRGGRVLYRAKKVP